MPRFFWASVFILGCVAAGWSQAYYEVSNQTKVFTLAAGAKVGSVAIRSGAVVGINSGISVTTTRSGIMVTLPSLQRGSADIALYDIQGRQMFRQQGFGGAVLRLETRRFAPGIYSMQIRANGRSYSRMVAVSGHGE